MRFIVCKLQWREDHVRDPLKLPWAELGIDIVIEGQRDSHTYVSKNIGVSPVLAWSAFFGATFPIPSSRHVADNG